MHPSPGPRMAVLALAAMAATHAGAFQFDTGNPDLTVRWDNTIKGSAKYRVSAADPALKNSFRLLVPGVPASSFPQALNFNAGDQNFQDRGFVSERIDVLSELDVVWRRDFGVRLSAAAWYDRELHRKTDADNDPMIGQTPYNEFPDRTSKIGGRYAEVLDAFVFGGWRFDNGMKLTARLGQHALQYGESLFFGDNGIARAQGPIDVDKLLASPNAQFKEFIRPVPQISAQLQLSPNLSIGGYYQFRWEEDRLPPAGSYFSTANIPWGSGQPEFANIPGVGNFMLGPGNDITPKDSGQFGVQLKWRLEETDLGFYFARYHDKGGQLFSWLDSAAPLSPFGTRPGSWFYEFPEDVKTVGISATRSIGDFNVAVEASLRDDMPLRNQNVLFGFAPGQPRPQLAKGRTAHVNLSTLATFGPNFLARESTLLAEIAWNRVLSKDDPDSELDKGRTRDATAIQMIYAPTYRQVLPGLDISVPFGVRYTIDGHSAVTVWDAEGSGSANIGIEGNYLNAWQFGVTYTHYLGSEIPFVDYRPLLSGGSAIYGHGNPLGDRNYLALWLRRTF